MGVQACRLPAPKPLKPSKRSTRPNPPHPQTPKTIDGFLWASSAGKSDPKARSIASSGRSRVPFARPSQPTGVPRPPSSAGNSDPKARSIASSGRSSVPFARPSQPTGVPRPHPWLLMGVQACRLPAPKPLKRSKCSKPSKRSKPSKPPKRQNRCNLQPTGVQRPASNAGHSDPTARSIASSKATSMASSGRPSLPLASP